LRLGPVSTVSATAAPLSLLDRVRLWAGNGSLVLAYSEMRDPQELLVVRCSTDGGASWVQPEPVRLSPQDSVETRHHAFQLAQLPDRTLALLWWRRNMVSGSKAVFLSRSTDSGKSWTIGPQVDPGAESFLPSMAAAPDGRILIVFLDERTSSGRSEAALYKLYFNLSSDVGLTWKVQDRLLPLDAEFSDVLGPTAAISGDSLLAVYFSSGFGGYAVRLARSEDQGRSWSHSTLDSNRTLSYYGDFWVGSSGDRLAVAFCRGRNRQAAIVYASSADHGATWNKTILNPSKKAAFGLPKVARSPQGVLAVAWESSEGDGFVPEVALSSDGGTSWNPPVTVPTPPGRRPSFRLHPEIAFAEDGALFVTWMDGPALRQDIYVNRTTDLGRTWLPAAVRLNRGTPDTPDAWLPAVVGGAGGKAWVTWQERDSNQPGPLYLRMLSLP
jgi:hypothetical protein